MNDQNWQAVNHDLLQLRSMLSQPNDDELCLFSCLLDGLLRDFPDKKKEMEKLVENIRKKAGIHISFFCFVEELSELFSEHAECDNLRDHLRISTKNTRFESIPYLFLSSV